MNPKDIIIINVVAHIESRILEINEHGEFSGLVIEMLDNLAFNSEYKFNITKPQLYKDAKMFGADGDFFSPQVEQLLLSGEVQLAGSSYYFVPTRAKHLAMLLPTLKDKLSAYFVQPHPIESKSLLTGPFTSQTLFLQMMMMILFIISGSIMLSISKKYLNLKTSFLESTWSVISAFNLQGCSIFETTLPLRVLLITVSAFFILMHSMYSAFLLSTLTSTINPIRSFPELLSLGYSIYSNPSLSEYLKKERSTKKFIKDMGTVVESFKAVFQRGHIHVDHGHEDVINYHLEVLNLDLSDAGGKLFDVPFPSRVCSGFYVSKNWTQRLREPLNRRIVRLGDNGFLHRYRIKYFRNSETFSVKRENTFFELKLVHIAILFILWMGCSLFAMIVFVVELICCRIFDKESKYTINN